MDTVQRPDAPSTPAAATSEKPRPIPVSVARPVEAPYKRSFDAGGASRGRSVFAPALLLALAFVAWSSFQTVVLLREAESLKTVAAAQQRPMEESTRLRGALDGLARDMQQLANQGNAGAKLVVEELRKRGVTINPASGNAGAADTKQ